MKFEIMKNTGIDMEAQFEDVYNLCIGNDWTEDRMTLEELILLRDFITEYVNRETQHYERR